MESRIANMHTVFLIVNVCNVGSVVREDQQTLACKFLVCTLIVVYFFNGI